MIGTAAEQAVIGAIMADSRAFRPAAEFVAPEDFSVLQFELIFAGITRMMAAREHVDAITVGDRLGEWEVNGLKPVDMLVLTGEIASVAGVSSYAEQVHNGGVRRAITVAAGHVLQGAQGHTPPGEVLARSITELQDIQKGAVKRELDVKTLAEVLAGEDDYSWIIPDLLEHRDRLVLTGGEGAGKSTFVRQLAILSAAGIHPTLFHEIEPVSVLVIDAENSEKQWRRAAQWPVKKAQGISWARDPAEAVKLACAPRLDLTRDDHLGQVHRLVDRFKPDVLFIGPLYRLTPRAITNDDDAAPLLAALDTLRDRGLALVMEAHAGHAVGAGGERDLRPRGSAALMGWPEFGKGIRVDKDSEGTRYDMVAWRGDREVRNWPTRMRRGNPGEWSWIPVDDGS